MEKVETLDQKSELWKSVISTLKEVAVTYRALGDEAMKADMDGDEELAVKHYQHRAAIIANLVNRLKEMNLTSNDDKEKNLIDKISALSVKAKDLAMADPKNVSLMKLSMMIGPYGGKQHNQLEEIINELEQPVNIDQEKAGNEIMLDDQYFYHKYEKDSMNTSESKALLKKLRQPLVELDFSDKNNSATFSSGDLKVDIKYCETKFSSSMRLHDDNFLDEKETANNWRELVDLKIKFREQEINLREILSEDWKIVFRTDSHHDANASNSVSDKTIAVGEKIDNLVGLFTMFHEIGHVQTYQKMNDKEFLQLVKDSKDLALNFRGGKKISSNAINNALNGERDAWTVALKMIKPFVKSGIISHNDLINYIHNTEEALGSYSKFISSLIERDLIIDKTREEINNIQ